jgi:biopolymer transport protein ExbB
MKKLLALFAVMMMLGIASVNYAKAEEAAQQTAQTAVAQTKTGAAAVDQEAKIEGQSAHQAIKQKFIEGGPGFMASIILCLIFGLAICIERIFYLNFSTTNTKKLLVKVEGALEQGGVEAAKEICRNTRGPVASIFYQGLDRHEEGLDMVEKSVVSWWSTSFIIGKELKLDRSFYSIRPHVRVPWNSNRDGSGFRCY